VSLDNAGAYFPTNDQKARTPIKALSISANNAARWKNAPAVGWYNGHWFFCLAGEINLGAEKATPVYRSQCPAISRAIFNLKCSRQHRQWLPPLVKAYAEQQSSEAMDTLKATVF
jgi:hypothetical protein